MSMPWTRVFWPIWWDNVKANHTVLSLFTVGRTEMTKGERCLVAALGLGFAWVGVIAQNWKLTQKMMDRNPFDDDDNDNDPDVTAINLRDMQTMAWESGVTSFTAGSLQMVLGEPLVENILSKDWDQKGGWRGAIGKVANMWAVALIVGTVGHAVYFTRKKGFKRARPMLVLWLQAWAMKLVLTENGSIGAKMMVGYPV